MKTPKWWPAVKLALGVAILLVGYFLLAEFWKARKEILARILKGGGPITPWVPDSDDKGLIYVKTETGVQPVRLPAGLSSESLTQVAYSPTAGVTVEVRNETIDRRSVPGTQP